MAICDKEWKTAVFGRQLPTSKNTQDFRDEMNGPVAERIQCAVVRISMAPFYRGSPCLPRGGRLRLLRPMAFLRICGRRKGCASGASAICAPRGTAARMPHPMIPYRYSATVTKETWSADRIPDGVNTTCALRISALRAALPFVIIDHQPRMRPRLRWFLVETPDRPATLPTLNCYYTPG